MDSAVSARSDHADFVTLCQRINPASPDVPPIIGTARAIPEATMFRISRSGSDEATDVA
jgi:hypothetical protein